MATHDYVIANGTGSAVRSDLNNALAAIVSNNSSSTQPSTRYAYQLWADTNLGRMKIRNSANDAWISLFELDGTQLMEDGTAAAPGIAFKDDLDTGLHSPAADHLGITTGGTQRVLFKNDLTVFNDGGGDVDFRVESDAQTHCFFINGGNSRVGLAESSPEERLHVNGNIQIGSSSPVDASYSVTMNANRGAADQTIGQVRFQWNDSSVASIHGKAGSDTTNKDDGALAFFTAASGGNQNERSRIDRVGRHIIGASTDITGSDSALLQVVDVDAAPILALGRNDQSISDNDLLARIAIFNNDATGYQECASIRFEADGAFADDDKPTKIAFRTSADGTSTPTTRLSIDSNGLLEIIGDNTSDQPAHIVMQGGGSSTATGQRFAKISFHTQDSNVAGSDKECAVIAAIAENDHGTNSDAKTAIAFYTRRDELDDPNERMRISNLGDVFIAKTAAASGNVGHEFLYDGFVRHVRNGNTVGVFNRGTNDGTILVFQQAANTEGTISVSGSTVSYNGGHLSRWSQLAGNAERTEILRGSVLSNLDEMCEWAHEAQDAVLYAEGDDDIPMGSSVGDERTPAVDAFTENNEQLNRMKVSDVEGDVNVSGVFQAWDDDDDEFSNDFYCAMTGDFVIRIAQGTTVARGDLLMSAGDGTAKPQDDDIVRSKTIAKVTSTTVSTTYSDGSYCVPCVLMAC